MMLLCRESNSRRPHRGTGNPYVGFQRDRADILWRSRDSAAPPGASPLFALVKYNYNLLTTGQFHGPVTR